MKTDELMDAITELDDALLDEAAGTPSPEEIRAAKRTNNLPLIFRMAAAAAVIALALILVPVFNRQETPGTTPSSSGEEPGTTMEEIIASADTEKAKLLAEPTYPEEWTWEQVYNNPVAREPFYTRLVNGKEAADLYRGFFADMMLLLLSDQEKESAVMSPVNIWMATAMLAEITDGETRQEILDAFGVKDIEALRDQAAKIWGLCYKDNGREKTVLGDSLWLSNSLGVRTGTLKRLADSYYASVYRGEMGSEALNARLREWINGMTGGLLEGQLQDAELPSDTALALVSTILHETKWADEFSRDATKPGIFHSPESDIEAQFMHEDKASLEYYYADDYKFMRKSTRQGQVFFFLPDEGTSVSDMMKEESFRELLSYPFNDQNYMDYNAGDVISKTYRGITGVIAKVNLTVPKVDISCRQDLTEAITKLGISTVFDQTKADYSPLTDQDGLFLSQALQNTRLLMDEEGISAASYVEYLAGEALIEDEIDLVFDRPFFMLVTGPQDIPLFAAVVNEP